MVIIIAHLEWGSSFPSSARPGRSYTSNTFTKTLCLGMGRAQVAATLVQAKPGTGAPKSWPTATSQWRVHQSSCSWCSGDGGKTNCRSF